MSNFKAKNFRFVCIFNDYNNDLVTTSNVVKVGTILVSACQCLCMGHRDFMYGFLMEKEQARIFSELSPLLKLQPF